MLICVNSVTLICWQEFQCVKKQFVLETSLNLIISVKICRGNNRKGGDNFSRCVLLKLEIHVSV